MPSEPTKPQANLDYGPAQPYEAFDALLSTDPDFAAKVNAITSASNYPD